MCVLSENFLHVVEIHVVRIKFSVIADIVIGNDAFTLKEYCSECNIYLYV